MNFEAEELEGLGLPTARTYGELEVIGPVHLQCSTQGEGVVEFEFHLFILPPQARYSVMMLGSPASIGGDGPLVRISSACIWSHLFASQHCDCGFQLEMAKTLIAREGTGLVVYCHDQHGKGIGLRNHFLVYAEGQRRGRELVVDAYEQLGFKEDYRNYDDVARILRHLGVPKCRLLTNNPGRLRALEGKGIGVVRVPLAARMTPLNASELTVKRTRLGHLFEAETSDTTTDNTEVVTVTRNGDEG